MEEQKEKKMQTDARAGGGTALLKLTQIDLNQRKIAMRGNESSTYRQGVSGTACARCVLRAQCVPCGCTKSSHTKLRLSSDILLDMSPDV